MKTIDIAEKLRRVLALLDTHRITCLDRLFMPKPENIRTEHDLNRIYNYYERTRAALCPGQYKDMTTALDDLLMEIYLSRMTEDEVSALFSDCQSVRMEAC